MVNIHADQAINFLQLASQQDEIGENKYELSLLTATAGGGAPSQKDSDKLNSQLNKVSYFPYAELVRQHVMYVGAGGAADWFL